MPGRSASNRRRWHVYLPRAADRASGQGLAIAAVGSDVDGRRGLLRRTLGTWSLPWLALAPLQSAASAVPMWQCATADAGRWAGEAGSKSSAAQVAAARAKRLADQSTRATGAAQVNAHQAATAARQSRNSPMMPPRMPTPAEAADKAADEAGKAVDAAKESTAAADTSTHALPRTNCSAGRSVLLAAACCSCSSRVVAQPSQTTTARGATRDPADPCLRTMTGLDADGLPWCHWRVRALLCPAPSLKPMPPPGRTRLPPWRPGQRTSPRQSQCAPCRPGAARRWGARPVRRRRSWCRAAPAASCPSFHTVTSRRRLASGPATSSR